MIVDIHSHWTPRGLRRALDDGTKWFGWSARRVDGRTELVASDGSATSWDPSAFGLEDPQDRITRRTVQGVDVEVLTLFAQLFSHHLPADQGAALCREVNAELADVQDAYPDRIRGLAVLPLQDVPASFLELDRVIASGFRGVAVAASVGGRNLDDPGLLRILDAIASSGLDLLVHPVAFEPLGWDWMPRHGFTYAFGAFFEAGIALMSVVYSGLLDRYPDLKMAFTHGGGVSQFAVGRLSSVYRSQPGIRPMAMPPEDYLRRVLVDCHVHDYDVLDLVCRHSGIEAVVLGTDYPNGLPDPVGWLSQSPHLGPDDLTSILRSNAAAFAV